MLQFHLRAQPIAGIHPGLDQHSGIVGIRVQGQVSAEAQVREQNDSRRHRGLILGGDPASRQSAPFIPHSAGELINSFSN